MPIDSHWLALTLMAGFAGSAFWASAQAGTAATAEQSARGFVPGQKRAPIDLAAVVRGKTLYGINCQACHGRDLRGGDMGGPNLLRSQAALKDIHGELIVPIIHGSRQSAGMPAFALSDADAGAVAAYLRSAVETIGGQGTPPTEMKPANILVGNANDGAAYFASKCGGCHSAQGDLRGIASKVASPKALQNLWVSGGTTGKSGDATAPTVSVTLAPGEIVRGQLLYIDEFLITMRTSDGLLRTITRDGAKPKVEVADPLKSHREMLHEYTDKEIHDVTAYLVTLR